MHFRSRQRSLLRPASGLRVIAKLRERVACVPPPIPDVERVEVRDAEHVEETDEHDRHGDDQASEEEDVGGAGAGLSAITVGSLAVRKGDEPLLVPLVMLHARAANSVSKFWRRWKSPGSPAPLPM